MSQVRRIARLLEQTFEGKPYYGPSVMGALSGVPHSLASQKPSPTVHSIAEIVDHMTRELTHALQVVTFTSERYSSTWTPSGPLTGEGWAAALAGLKRAGRALVRAVLRLDDTFLEQRPDHVRGPFYLMPHGTLQHNIYHAGQIVLLKKMVS